jgi:A/G-specific adenine glycosylase
LNPEDSRIALLRRRILTWWETEARVYPWRRPGRSAYEILIAEVLLKRTTATAAARVYEVFLERFPSVEAIHVAEDEDLRDALGSIGLYRQRARGLKEMSQYLMEAESGKVPTTLAGLIKVPHVGAYTAAAVASFALGIPAAVLDSNVERILRRVFKDKLDVKSASLRQLADVLLPEAHRDFNLALIDFGALVCRYIRPKCDICPIVDLCDYGRKTTSSP